MRFYSRVVFPRVINWTMSDGETTRIRREVLAEALGRVLELGFGVGLNLPHYPPRVKRLTAVDPNPGMKKAAQKKIAVSPIKVDLYAVDGEELPFEDKSFDTIVCTWTLCSLRDPGRALAQCHRVLRRSGKYLFVEHGLADNCGVRKLQNWLDPCWRIVGDGCHLNRNIKGLIQGGNFRIERLKNFYMPGVSRVAGYMYQGVAVKA